MKFPGLGFAPWHVPLERRLQTLAVLFHVWTFIFMGFSSLLLLIILMFTPVWYIPLLYLMWYVYDFNQSSRGGRRREWVRKLPLWNWFRDYFPIKLIKTADLDPRYNYIIGGHPHGIMGLGIMSTMLTEAHGFSQLYPGITNVLLSLKLMHYFPFYREYIMAFGICDVSKESISYLMQKDHGVAVTIVVGGAKEAFDANPGQSKLVLKSRKDETWVQSALRSNDFKACSMLVFRKNIWKPRWSAVLLVDVQFLQCTSVLPWFLCSTPTLACVLGHLTFCNNTRKWLKWSSFIRICGAMSISASEKRLFRVQVLVAHLVPTYSFGENDVYRLAITSPQGSTTRRIQRFLQRRFGVAPIIFLGRGIFNYDFGLLPYRKPITTVVGAPIRVEKRQSPSSTEVDELHHRYLDELRNLFDKYKEQCGYGNHELEFID